MKEAKLLPSVVKRMANQAPKNTDLGFTWLS